MVADGGGSNSKPILGIEEATIDDKGRILVAKKKRDRIGEQFALALGANGCLNAYPQDVWEFKWQEIQRHDSLNFGREQYSRMLLGYADDEMKFDAQGRVVIPQRLRDAAKLVNKVVLVGAGDHFEIWAADEWAEYNKDPMGYGAERRKSFVQAYKEMVSQG